MVAEPHHVPVPESYWEELKARSQAMVEAQCPFDLGVPTPITDRKVSKLDDLLRIIAEARKNGLDVESADDPKSRNIGFVIENDWFHISLPDLRGGSVSPEVAVLFGPEELPQLMFRRMCSPEGRLWVATGRYRHDDPPDSLIHDLDAVWKEEVDSEGPSEEEMEAAFGKTGTIEAIRRDRDETLARIRAKENGAPKTPLQKIEVVVRVTDADGEVDETVFDMNPSAVQVNQHRPVKKVDGGLEVGDDIRLIITGLMAPSAD